MKRSPAMKREIETASELEEWLASPSRSNDVVFQGLDLTRYESKLLTLDLRGCVFVGCRMSSALAAHIGKFTCINFPPLPGKPFDPFRVALYTPEELLAGFDADHPETYAKTPDAIIYAHYKDPSHCGLDDVLARRIHDFSIDDALDDNIGAWSGSGVVGVMGGHSVPRGDAAYVAAARLARTLAREGFLIVTGGGPGIMEAANLGVYLAPHPDDGLDVAIRELTSAPLYDDPQYLVPAFRVRKMFPAPSSRTYRSLGVPTWFYGHEKPNVFATYLAKYFENSIREDGLLAVSTRGIIFAEGGAGTLQEIFDSACQVYYQSGGRERRVMILFGSAYWNPPGDGSAGRAKKVYPLLRKLGEEGGFGELIKVSDSIDEIAAMIRAAG